MSQHIKHYKFVANRPRQHVLRYDTKNTIHKTEECLVSLLATPKEPRAHKWLSAISIYFTEKQHINSSSSPLSLRAQEELRLLALQWCGSMTSYSAKSSKYGVGITTGGSRVDTNLNCSRQLQN